jgi:glutamate-ammonia-ligase adenylyltransferase
MAAQTKKGDVWRKAIKASADSERAAHFFNLLTAIAEAEVKLARFTPEQARVTAALLSGSLALSNQLVANPGWLELLDVEHLKFPRRKQGLSQELNELLAESLDSKNYSAGLAQLRHWKQREMFRIGARDLARLGALSEILLEISDVADVCLNLVWQISLQQIEQRHGRPYHRDANEQWQPTKSCVLGLGKLGGQELNYSSDVDVVFVYSEEGEVFKEPPGGKRTAPRATMRNHQFFNRVAETFISEVTRLAPEGSLYRIDLRLRPEGDTGPLTRSLAGFENYYSQWGQTWERMMLIKARRVAGDGALEFEFLEMIQPFRYPRSINQGVLREVGAMKDRIETEVLKPDELERNVKLGRGGIREIEFIAQALQLLHAGRQPFLQGAQTLPCLDKLTQYDLLTSEQSNSLQQAYCFLRDVEHRLQMEDNRQTHTLPENRDALERLARLMGFAQLAGFKSALRGHTKNVRQIFDRILHREVPELVKQTAFPREFKGFENEWKRLLAEHSFRDADKALRMLQEFVEGPGFVHVSARTKDLALQLLPRLLESCRRNVPRERARLSDPDRVVTRLDSFIAAYGARATMFELWNSNPAIFDLLVLLFDRSEFLAELAIRTPDLVDELVTSGRLRQRKSSEETLRDLRHGLADADQHLWMRKYHQAELMRIGLRDILRLADFEQYLVELSALADACLQYALESVMRKHKLKSVPFAIIGLGKLGGAEIDYGSDLDIVFVADAKAKDLPRLSKFAVEVMDLLTKRTEQGLLFQTDARLRPDGEKGLLVNRLPAYEEYYRQRAMLWEIQTLTRARPIAGDKKVGEQFQKLAAKLTNFKQPSRPLAAFAVDWKAQIDKMRMRIEKERTPKGKDELAIKTGAGGLMDAEFVAQALCLENGWQEPNTLGALQRARLASLLPEPERLIENYGRLRRVEGILRRWSYEGETVLPDDPAPFYRVSVRCGFETPEEFRTALAQWRKEVRHAYSSYFEETPAKER